MTEKQKPTFFHLRHDVLVCLFIVVATLAVYWQVQHFDFVNFDDNDYVYENRHVQNGLTLQSIAWAFTTTHAANWHPLTWMSHMLDCQLFGLNPGWHHLTNLIIHIANSLLLYLVFRRMTHSLWRSAFAAALFALHPCHVGSVAWISERKDVLSSFFWMLTLWSYIMYVEHPAAKRYFGVVLCFILGLMSKPMLVTLPFVLLLLDYWPLNRLPIDPQDTAVTVRLRSNVLRLVWEKAPLFALIAISSVITVYAQKHGGLVVSLDVIPLEARITNAMVAYVKYIGKMIYPAKLAAIYPHPGILPWWQIIGSCLLLVSISYAVIKFVKQRPYLSVGWLWYLGTLVPVIGLVQVGNQAMADRYTYVPFIGLFIIIAWGAPEITARWKYGKKCLSLSSAVILAALMAATWKQVGYWKNSITLFEHNLKVTAENSAIHNCLGAALDKQGLTEEAIDHYLDALRIKPNFEEAHNNLGYALEKQGRTQEAIDHYLKALRINPDNEIIYNNLGNVFDKLGRTKEAIGYYLKALQIDPNYADTHNNLGNALLKQGQTAEALEHFHQALRLNPKLVPAYNSLAVALIRTGKPDQAIDRLQMALKINPDDADAHVNLGGALINMGKNDEAIAHCRKALQIKPDNPKAHMNLGIALANTGRIHDAIAHLRKALQLDPDNVEVRHNLNNILTTLQKIDREIANLQAERVLAPEDPGLNYSLGNLYKMKGDLDRAEDYYRKAIALQPKFPEALYELAKVYIDRKNYAKALSIYQQVIMLLPDSPAVYYNIACIYAQQNKPEESVTWLQKAVAKGFDDWNHIKTDSDLEKIRSSSEYKTFVEGR